MALVKENIDEFNRHSCRYKQFKVNNTRRTSTPQPLVRPKNTCKNITSDPAAAPLPPQAPSRCPDVDTTYVSYVQWRHYLVVPNSARKFKVRYTGVDQNIPFRCGGTIISGNINMMPYFHPDANEIATAQRNFYNRFKKQPSKDINENVKRKKANAKVEDMLNSRIAVEARRDGRRNQRIADIVMPSIKKGLKRIFVGELGIRKVTPVKSKTAKIYNNFTSMLGARRERSEDRECLIDLCDSVGE